MKGSTKEGIVQTTRHAAQLMVDLTTCSVQVMSASVWMQMVQRYPELMSSYPMEDLTALLHEKVILHVKIVNRCLASSVVKQPTRNGILIMTF